MAGIDDLLGRVSPAVAGCPRAVMLRELTEAAIEFCRDTHAQQETCAVPLVSGTAVYVPTPTAGWRAIAVTGVRFAGLPVRLTNPGLLDHENPGWRLQDGQQPLRAYATGPGTVGVWPTPNALTSGSIDVDLAEQPVRGTTAWADTLDDEYLEPIAAGARSRLHRMANQPWSNPNQAALDAALFEDGKAEAKLLRAKGWAAHSSELDRVTLA